MPKFEDVELLINADLIPKTMWNVNLRSELPKKWNEIRKNVYVKADYKCEICGNQGKRHLAEAHEIWAYDDDRKIMALNKVVALCPKCHLCHHLGFAEVKGKLEIVLKHLQKINGFKDYKQVVRYLDAVTDKWAWRSRFDWKLDISKAKQYFKN